MRKFISILESSAVKYKFVFIFLIAVIFSGCRNKDAGLLYETSPRELDAKAVKIDASLRLRAEKGELTLYLTVKNNSANTISVNYLNCSLSINSERVSIPETKKTFKNVLSPGGKENYELYYHPVNSMEYFNKSGYKGDMKQKYSLTLNFIKNQEGDQLSGKKITFALPDGLYHDYLTKFGKEDQIKLFDCALNRDSFISGQKNYYKSIIALNDNKQRHLKDGLTEDFVMVSNLDLNIENRLLSFLSYQQGDTLFMNVKLLNYGGSYLKILFNKCTLNVAGKTISPKQILSEYFNYNQIIDSTLTFQRGARFLFTLKYFVPKNTDQYQFNMDWLLVQRENSIKDKNEYPRLFYKNLTFVKSSDKPATTD